MATPSTHPSKPKKEKRKNPRWNERNFITEVLIPSFFVKRSGVQHRPVFPTLQRGQIGLTWIGHASFLIQTPKHNILVDPNWANWLIVIRRLKRAGLAIHDLPNIDLVLITHAHFDHLNRRTLAAIAAQQPIVVPSGVSNLVHDLGFERVHEMNWWDVWEHEGLKITFTPAKHWGARVLHDSHRGYGGYVRRVRGPAGLSLRRLGLLRGLPRDRAAARAGDRAAAHRRVRAALGARSSTWGRNRPCRRSRN